MISTCRNISPRAIRTERAGRVMDVANRGLDLEKELTCSVSCLHPRCASISTYMDWANVCHVMADLYRASIPTFDPPRLSPYLLRLLSERLVQLPAGRFAQLPQPTTARHTAIYMPVMSRTGARNEAECDGDDAAGYVSGCEPGPEQV